MSSWPVQSACERAREDALHTAAEWSVRAALGRPRRVAIGDPQASLPRFIGILDDHGLLGDEGRLHEEVHLVSLGDHFDWGAREERENAAASGLQILAWLAAHPPDQVTLILGNHDLARVGEMAVFDDEEFRLAQAEADAIYSGGTVDRQREREFLARWPALPTAECAARDFSSFRSTQRALVTSLLRARRFCAATAASDSLLLCHAGVTSDDLRAIGLGRDAHGDARVVADALNAALDAAVAAWPGGAGLAIPGLHQPGDAAHGEGRGIFYHRPGAPRPENGDLFAGPPRRRFDPRGLPRRLTQAIGHIGDRKCRDLLGPWAVPELPVAGPLRHLRTDGEQVRYASGLPQAAEPGAATLLFLDGTMARARPGAYELLDLDTESPAARRQGSTSAGTPG
jgi:hypothetical protein